MTVFSRLANSWRAVQKSLRGKPSTSEPHHSHPATRIESIELDLPRGDPFMSYLARVPGIIKIERLILDSPALSQLKRAGVKLVVPLISQGELIGLINLGPRLSEQDFSSDDLRLLETLATWAAPALRVAQLVQQQQAEARRMERIAQELRVARVIQETLLPKEIPALPGWQLTAHWQPARAVSGDFYDFITFPDGRLGVFIADVTDKGVPAALVMATTRSVLRSTADGMVSPGKVLEQANNLLCPDMPMGMFVTCLYAIIDLTDGYIRYANAGHLPPYQRCSQGLVELRARGMPLGLMPDMVYEEKETCIAPGDNVFLYSDGLIEAHSPQEEMFGFPRLRELLAKPGCVETIKQCLMGELAAFTGPDWEQEDDVTLVTLERFHIPQDDGTGGGSDGILTNFLIPSEPGNEHEAVEKVVSVIQGLELSPARLDRLKTAVAEATMNAMEHGNHYNPDKPVQIMVTLVGDRLSIQVTDFGSGMEISPEEIPDLEARLEGLRSPRGWGLFLIKNMVDEMNTFTGMDHYTLELVIHLKGGLNDPAV